MATVSVCSLINVDVTELLTLGGSEIASVQNSLIYKYFKISTSNLLPSVINDWDGLGGYEQANVLYNTYTYSFERSADDFRHILGCKGGGVVY